MSTIHSNEPGSDFQNTCLHVIQCSGLRLSRVLVTDFYGILPVSDACCHLQLWKKKHQTVSGIFWNYPLGYAFLDPAMFASSLAPAQNRPVLLR